MGGMVSGWFGAIVEVRRHGKGAFISGHTHGLGVAGLMNSGLEATRILEKVVSKGL